MYLKLTADQVRVVYNLFRFLERLKITGHVEAHTERAWYNHGDVFDNYQLHDFTDADYSIIKDGYNSSQGYMDALEQLERVFVNMRSANSRGTPK